MGPGAVGGSSERHATLSRIFTLLFSRKNMYIYRETSLRVYEEVKNNLYNERATVDGEETRRFIFTEKRGSKRVQVELFFFCRCGCILSSLKFKG